MPRLSTSRIFPIPSVRFLPGMKAPTGEHAFHVGPRIGRAAYYLDRLAVAGIDHAHAQPVGIGMRLGFDHTRNDERREQLRLVLNAFDFEPDHGELGGDLIERTRGVEMLPKPGEGELHHGISFAPPLTSSTLQPTSANREGGSRSATASAHRLRRRRADRACRI